MLSIDGLDVFYGESHILRGVHMHVPAGKVVCLMGRNGVGKTTLLKAIAGALPARRGSVTYDDEDITKAPSHVRARAGIAYVPQGREIFPRLTVRENLLVGLEARTDRVKDVPESVLALFPALRSMLTRRGGDLSGGQQQQLAIGRALVSEPRLLLLDEPTEGIQPSIIQEIEQVIRRVRDAGETAVLLVEQYLDFARALGDLYYIMDRGSIVAEGETRNLTDEVVRTHLTV
ncbi:urea ABC transporter ATP-binding subunit UrtE [Candidatus Poribacteria bacterium]|jgi:urea transport system ATP-binding protein|nr:urea ABC transporter ATP-binding subunit UrtE [Candidatus Poribacteria bacterium]MBT5532618.1 urea ABC transporter ATP-binding subunit UrtE [Candidatus Poribacteria bacterium]MBT5710872.1 urea ABC transporter ATP-binding subunit UrtE [Candidatus Poribacteria bacterium]MBT7100901.1 urea ABC transporter ATP-binding subunit UrtE [Candidatus Poribacteria bacterium]MBT7808237.1 urea ABC transporter ATP-binding subunit UrtE [Candidatus Poribacteria bacterium]